MKVFLGGTVNGSTWRDAMIPRLKIAYFNPVVSEWNDEAYQRELYERETCEFCLYIITPKMTGFYSLAEVTDDSYKKADKTIYCYLSEDEEYKFTSNQIDALERLGKLVQAHGAVWKRTMDEVVDFLNSAADLADNKLLQSTDQINNCFISYGRRHSLAFATRLYKSMTSRGLTAWFDMNDIPLGVDFQEQIDDGIRKSDTFIYIMSPHSINSIYCYKELVLALKYNKRIVPILHVEPQDKVTWDKIDNEIGRRNWIYCRQDHDAALELSNKAYDLKDKIVELPDTEWNFTDNFDIAFENLLALIDSHRAYVRTHTVLLNKALKWTTEQQSTQNLLVGNERSEAERWLERSHQIFKNSTGHLILPPCTPTDLMAQYIMESKKNGNNLQCDLFICHDLDDSDKVRKIASTLAKHGFSSWMSSKDIRKGVEYNHAIHNGVIQSASILFFISKKSLQSEYCKKEYNFALRYNKRIIPLLIEECSESFSNSAGFEGLVYLQYVNFTDFTDEIKVEVKDLGDVKADVEARREKTPYEHSTDELVNALNDQRSYYEEHRVFLVQAVRWSEQQRKSSFLLRGFNLENAETWLRINSTREAQAPTEIHKEFITASAAAKGQLGSDVFLSYSRKDSDFARRLNEHLQMSGKTCWFDQESISKGVDFEKEIFKGIDRCDNFMFILSPDSVGSIYCEREVLYAANLHKRLIPILWRETAPETIPEPLRIINWIDFKNAEFSKSFTELVQEIETDYEYAHSHTVWQQRATEWHESGRIDDFLLNATACANAEKWLAEAYGKTGITLGFKNLKGTQNYADLKAVKNPAPTPFQIDVISQSRKTIKAAAAAEMRKRRRLKLIVVLAVIMAAIAVFSAISAWDIYNKLNITQFNQNFSEGKKLMNSFEYTEAIKAFKRAGEFESKKSHDSLAFFIKRCDTLDSLQVYYNQLITKADALVLQGERNYLQASKIYLQANEMAVGEEALLRMERIKPLIENTIEIYDAKAKKFDKSEERQIANNIRKTIYQLKLIIKQFPKPANITESKTVKP